MSHLAIQAQDYLNAYQILKESNHTLIGKKNCASEKEHSNMAYGARPAMGVDTVCLAFSLELHLKELNRVVSKKIPKGHNIEKLFQTLPKSVQAEVFSHHSIAQYGYSDKKLEYELKEISDGYVKWRYAYESTALRYSNYFAEALIEASRHIASKGTKCV
ncbi:MAG: hypothetical protein ACQES2_11495 [Pseudomonadota bacterium]